MLIQVTRYNLFKQVCLEEIQIFLDAFKHLNETMKKGLIFRDKPYTCVRADKHSIYAKNVSKTLVKVIQMSTKNLLELSNQPITEEAQCIKGKGIIHPQMSVLSSFTHPILVSNIYTFLMLNTKEDILLNAENL